MIKDGQRGLFEHIIFIKLDRFFRSVAEYHECMKNLGAITWTATEEKYDLATANGRAFVNMKLTIAELEADQTGERIKLVNEYKAKTGQPLTGSVPWSHAIVKTENGKRVVINEETRAQALEVIQYFIECQSLRRTLEYCNKYHRFYDIKGLKRWLTSPLLIGRYRDNPNYCEPLIDMETYNMILEKSRHNLRESKYGPPMFSRLLVCPDCGRRLVGMTWHSYHNGKRYTYKRYRCDNNGFKRGCPNNKVLTERQIERVLLDSIEQYADDKPRKYEVKEKRPEPVNVDALKKKLDRLNYMFENGRLTVEEYDAKYSQIQKEIDDAQNIEAKPSDPEKIEKIQKILAGGWRSMYAALEPDYRREFWHTVIKSAEIKKDGRHYEVTRLEIN